MPAMPRRTLWAALPLIGVLALGGCTPTSPATPTAGGTASGASGASGSASGLSGSPEASASPAATSDPTPTIVAPGAHQTPSAGGVRLAPTASGQLDGQVIVLDPGHNSQWITAVNAKLIKMYGIGRRPCQSLGGTAPDGKTLESNIVWDVAQRAQVQLRAKGATVVLTRPDDQGTGPCNNERAEIANRNAATMLMSLHLDGADNEKARGYHVLYSEKMLGGATSVQASKALAESLAKQLAATGSGIPASKSVGTPQLPVAPRSHDLGVLNGVGTGAAVLAEFGMLSNPDDWNAVKTEQGRQSLATALTNAAVAALDNPAFAAAKPKVTSSAMPVPVASAAPAATTPAAPPAAAPTPAATTPA